MRRILFFNLLLLLSLTAFSQSLSDYSYVVVPEQFEFLSGKDQYKINSMTKFYFEKNGFHPYFTNDAPNTNRCDGLYADVEELWSILGTKLQVVLKDCNGKEIYRSAEGKSKYKEFDKTYQDALRKAFESIERLNVHQKNVVLLESSSFGAKSQNKEIVDRLPNKEMVQSDQIKAPNSTENNLPVEKFSSYSYNGKTYLLRKTTEGYSLYEESSAAEDGLLLKGKIVLMDSLVKYLDSDGNVFDAIFDTSKNLTVKNNSSTILFTAQN